VQSGPGCRRSGPRPKGGELAGRVINLNDKPRPAPETYEYVGRRQWCGKELFEASFWANYYSVKRYGRGEATRLWEERRLPQLRAMPNYDEELRRLAYAVLVEGKDVACWCAPLDCHARLVLRLIEEFSSREEIKELVREHIATSVTAEDE
jgi:Domain of unknown function (DUF4326)